MSMTRHRIDTEIGAALLKAGINHWRLQWTRNPATLKVLVGEEIKTEKVGTRITVRDLERLKDKIKIWGGQHAVYQEKVREARANRQTRIGQGDGSLEDQKGGRSEKASVEEASGAEIEEA